MEHRIGNELRRTSINDAETGLPNLEAVTSLAAIATCLQDDELLEAAISEIEGLPTDKRLELDPAGEVDRLLVAHHLARVRSMPSCHSLY